MLRASVRLAPCATFAFLTAQQPSDCAASTRDLTALPKAHLHLRFDNAAIRRETLEEWAADERFIAQREEMAEDALAKAAAIARQNTRAESHRRRAQLLTSDCLFSSRMFASALLGA